MKKTVIIISAIVLVLALAAAAVYFFAIAPGKNYISRDAAKEAALSELGVSASDVLRIDADLETENGYTYYEVSLVYDKTEYEYCVDAVTGEILNTDRESVFD